MIYNSYSNFLLFVKHKNTTLSIEMTGVYINNKERFLLTRSLKF